MESTKRSLNSTVLNDEDTKKKKRKVKTIDANCLSKKLFTHLEDLSNEIFYEIFEYLNFFHVYQSFFNLNIQFRKLLICSNLPIKINIPSITRSNFQDYCIDIIIPYPHRIISLCITNFIHFEFDISPHRILSIFTQLKTLILENITTVYVDNLLRDIASLSNLSSLVIIGYKYITINDQFFLDIFRLPALKYCKISFTDGRMIPLLPFVTNGCSPLEQLVIESNINLDNIIRLLSYVPQLRRLSLSFLVIEDKNELNQPITLNHLTHLFLKLDMASFEIFEVSIKKFFYTIQVLHLFVMNGEEFLDANRWEQLILSSMPFLRIFDIYIHSLSYGTHEFQFNQFNSPFWFERKWFFAHQNSSLDIHETIFYSINPYRRKKFMLKWKMNEHTHLDYQETNLNLVRHVCISNKEAYNNCIYHFPNATDLTLENISSKRSNELISSLKHMIPLQNLTKLDIEHRNYPFTKLIELLLLTPNIVTLKINCIKLNSKDFEAIQNDENFLLLSHINTIRNLMVERIEIQEAKLMFILCRQLEHFEITMYNENADSIVQSILSEDNDNTRHLISVCIKVHVTNYPDRSNILDRNEKFFNGYLIKVDGLQMHLWR